MIRQGDIYWFETTGANGAPIAHPHVVVRADGRDDNHPDAVIVCALTTNLKRVRLPGNVLLDAGEANLPRPSVVEVAKVLTVEKTQLGEFIGSLDERRVAQILAGMRFVQSAYFTR